MSSSYQKTYYSQTNNEIAHEQPRSMAMKYNKSKEESNLKKKTKKNHHFREVQEPIEY